MPSQILKRYVAEATKSLVVRKAAKKTLYVNRPVLNAEDLMQWARSAGFSSVIEAEDLHVTVAFSKTPVNWLQIGDDWNDRPDWTPRPMGIAYAYDPRMRRDYLDTDPPGSLRAAGGAREVKALGDKGAVVLCFDCLPLVERWCQFRRAGCSWDYPSFSPHVTITYQAPRGLDLKSIAPFEGDILLGEEEWDEVDEDWSAKEAKA